VKSLRFNLDALGMCASTLCMIHCLVFPFLLAALPMWKLSADGGDRNVAVTRTDSGVVAPMLVPAQGFEQGYCPPPENAEGSIFASASCCSTPTDFWIHVGLLAAVAPLGIVAWGAGYRRHRQIGVLGLGLVGVLLLSGALLFGHHLLGGRGEQVMTVAGSICMVGAHLWNRHHCRCCQAPDLARLVEIDAAPDSQPVTLPATR
jgi:hypothetical protein